MGKTDANIEPWFLNAKLAYHRTAVVSLQEQLVKQAVEQIETITALAEATSRLQATERRLQEATRG